MKTKKKCPLRKMTKKQLVRHYRGVIAPLRKEVKRLVKMIEGARLRAQADVINNDELAQIVKKLERLILEQSVALSAKGLSQYALPPIACFKSVYPQLFTNRQSNHQPTSPHAITGS